MRSDSGFLTRVWLLATVVGAALSLAACGGSEPSQAERADLDARYISVAGVDTCTVLVLEKDGRFLVLEEDRDRLWEQRLRPGPTPLATGTWTLSDDRLALEGGGWQVLFEADSTRVQIPSRAATLSSLRWITSTEGSPFDACDLVSITELDEFLHPTEGSGSSGW